MKNEEMNVPKPLIGPEQSLPEITFKVIILSIILTIILAAANAYLGLKVGTTVSSSIPAAVISMAVLRFFRRHNVLENNKTGFYNIAVEVINKELIIDFSGTEYKINEQFYNYESFEKIIGIDRCYNYAKYSET